MCHPVVVSAFGFLTCKCLFQPDVMEGNVFDGRLDHIRLDPDVGAVVVGFDSHISFNKILKASSYLKNPDVLFVATNRDERFPMEHIVCPGEMLSSGDVGEEVDDDVEE